MLIFLLVRLVYYILFFPKLTRITLTHAKRWRIFQVKHNFKLFPLLELLKVLLNFIPCIFFFFVVVVPQVEVTKSTCNSTTNKVETGTINTPKYPKDYGSNSRCEWLITSSHRIKLVFNYFFVENGWDYFHVYEGKSTSSKRIGKLTGGHTNKVIKSSGNYLYLKFTSDSVINKKGFLIAYEGNSVTSLILLLL